MLFQQTLILKLGYSTNNAFFKIVKKHTLKIHSVSIHELIQDRIKKRGPQALTVTSVSEKSGWFLSEGLIFAQQQPNHRINKNQQWHKKAAA